MSTAFTAIVRDSYGASREVPVTASKKNGESVVRFYAPGWRPMQFSNVVAAARKVSSHPQFEGWAI